MPLPIRTRVFWSLYRPLERRPVLQQPPERIAAARALRSRVMGLRLSAPVVGRANRDVVVEDTSFPVADGTRIGLRSYRPRSMSADERLPVVVYFHGGGWVSGDPRQSEWWASTVAALVPAVVVSVDYRLAPEHPFPTPVEDGYAATAWTAGHGDELGVDPARLVVMGDSAGGSMAAVVSVLARDRGGPAVAGQVLVYPSVDLAGDYPSARENVRAPVLTPQDMANAQRLYLGPADPTDPRASPLRAEHHDLPPALVQTAQYDPLRDEGAAYARALRAAGVPVRLTEYVGAVHGYASLPGVVPAARQALAEAVAFVRETVAPS